MSDELEQGLNELLESNDTLAGSALKGNRFSEDAERERELVAVFNAATEEIMRRTSILIRQLVEYHFKTYQLAYATFANRPWLQGKTQEIAETIEKVMQESPGLRYDEAFTKVSKIMEEKYGRMEK